ncbi:MAG: glycosyltransferase family 2 protein [Butyrivibrio sp.]|nr:glycosyltransferase family 2 protein [Butyrivibrio sp.]
MRKLSIVIPNYNGAKFIPECFEALKRQSFKDFDVILVDNASEDESLRLARESAGELELRVIELDINYGFARAANEGIKASGAEYVILLNNDTKAGVHFAEELLLAVDGYNDIFSAQAHMLRYDDSALTDSAGDYFCVLGWAFSRGKDKPARLYREDCEIFSSCAGAAIYRRAVFDKIGYFDEKFFAYLEDVDIGYRAWLNGYRNIFAHRAKVLHVGSGASGSRHNSFKVSLAARNAVFLMHKNFAPWQKAVNFVPVLIGVVIKAAFFASKGLGRDYIKGVFSALGGLSDIKKPEFSEICVYNSRFAQRELCRALVKLLRESL